MPHARTSGRLAAVGGAGSALRPRDVTVIYTWRRGAAFTISAIERQAGARPVLFIRIHGKSSLFRPGTGVAAPDVEAPHGDPLDSPGRALRLSGDGPA
ncbi:hypothetical protein M3640_20395, partial [Bacillus velezensis]|nr:hypothetical protein [Bacillus velezensis]